MNKNSWLLIFILFFLTFFSFIFFIAINQSINPKNKKKYLVIKIFQIFFLSIILCLLIYIPEFENFKKNNEFLISYWYIPIITIIGILFSHSIMTICTLILCIFTIINYSLTNLNASSLFIYTTLQLFPMTFTVLLIYLLKLINKNKLKINLFVLNIVITIILFCTNASIKNNQFLIENYTSISLIFVLQIMLFYIGDWYKKFIRNIKHLDEIKKYEKEIFLNYDKAKKIITSNIQNKNIKYGLIVVLDLININRLPILWGNNIANHIKKLIVIELTKKFENIDVIFFVSKSNEYCCFIELNSPNIYNLNTIYSGNSRQIRSDRDPLHDIQVKMMEIPKIISCNNKKQKINAGAYAAIYGIHSCNIDELVKFAIAAKQQNYNNNKNGVILNIYNPNKILILKNNTNSNLINQNNSWINPNKIQIKVIKKHTKKLNYFDCHVSATELLLFNYDEIKQIAINKNLLTWTVRMLAMQCLKKYSLIKHHKDYFFKINYSLNYILSPNFNYSDLKNKLDFLKINQNDLIFEFNLIDYKKEDNEIWNNLFNLQNSGIKIIFNDINENNFEIIEKFKPDFIKIENNLDFIKRLKKFNIEIIY